MPCSLNHFGLAVDKQVAIDGAYTSAYQPMSYKAHTRLLLRRDILRNACGNDEVVTLLMTAEELGTSAPSRLTGPPRPTNDRVRCYTQTGSSDRCITTSSDRIKGIGKRADD